MLRQLEVAAAAVLQTPPAVHFSGVVFLSPAVGGSYTNDLFQVSGMRWSGTKRVEVADVSGGWSGRVMVSVGRAGLKI